MYTHQFQKRVRYGETDQMGYLYYGNYAQYYEIGRVEMLRSLGMTYKYMEEELQVMMPVVSMQTRYVRPAYYDEMITIQTTVKEMPDKYITFYMELFNEAGKLLNGGQVRLCFVKTPEYKTVEAPDELKEKMSVFFEKK